MSTSTMELVVPESQDMARALPSETLYKLEVAGQIATEILDERVIDWTNSGWSQRQIAEELGCSQQAISKRQKRIGIESLNEWRENSPGGGDNRVVTPEVEVEASEEEEVEPDAIVEPHDEVPAGAQYLPDVVAVDADENLRTVALRWFEWGLDVRKLLDDSVQLESKSDADAEAIRVRAEEMVEIATRLKEEIR